MIKYIFLTLVNLVAYATKETNDVSIHMLTKRLTRNFDFGALLMFFENFTEESKSKQPMQIG